MSDPTPTRIFCWPDRPGENLLLFHIAAAGGWEWVDRPEDANIHVLHRDATWLEPGAGDPWEDESVLWVNGRCRDISKSRVSRLVTETMGYPLEVDPTTYTGLMVRKSDRNFTKDVEVLRGPTDEVVPGKVYQRMVDSRIAQDRFVNHRLVVVGNRFIAMSRSQWVLVQGGFIFGDRPFTRHLDPRDEFSEDELASILRFCTAYGIDYGSLDVMRDRDGRIAVVDANTTMGDGPISRGDLGARHLPQLVAAFEEQFSNQRTVLPEQLGRRAAPPIRSSEGLRVFAWPDHPNRHLLLSWLAVEAGWHWVRDPGQADLRFLQRDATQLPPGTADPWEAEAATWINGRCRDVSKGRVARTWEEVSGLSLAVDPTRWQGTMLRKSEANATKDGMLVQGPLAAPEAGFAYQRFLDDRVAPGLLRDYRLMVVGGELLPLAIREIRRVAEGRVTKALPEYTVLLPLSDVLSPENADLLLRFCARYELDYGAIDTVRDRDSGFLWPVDANNTPGVEAGTRQLSTPWGREGVMPWLADLFVRNFAMTPGAPE